jgi:dihydrofolate reductase
LTTIAYMGMSLDGHIAGPNGDLGWLEFVPIPEGDDLGFAEFMERIDAVVMGRTTFETLIGFGCGWHYSAPGIILSTTMTTAPDAFAEHVRFASGSPAAIIDLAREQGFETLYIDGGDTVQRFLRDDLLDEIIITSIPILLGGGTRLFGDLASPLGFELVGSSVQAGQLVRRHYRRMRQPGRTND